MIDGPFSFWSAAVKNILAVALVVSVASIALSQNANPPAQLKPVDQLKLDAALPPADPAAGAAPVLVPVTTQRWEYKVSDRGGFEPGDWQKKLNDLAAEGWELNAIDEGHYILRRHVQFVGGGFGGGGGGGGFF
jgi:hypothetical protein